MKFNAHSNLLGEHAFLIASNYHWLNYDLNKLTDRYLRHLAVERGTQLHEYAAMAIRLGLKQPKSRQTLCMYINDAIGYRMTPEQPLYYSPNCVGTADAIAFDKNFLRIHDLKTGETATSFHQLEIYAGLFCLEYRYKPDELNGIELRIYQNNEMRVETPNPEDIYGVMKTIELFDQQIEKLKVEG